MNGSSDPNSQLTDIPSIDCTHAHSSMIVCTHDSMEADVMCSSLYWVCRQLGVWVGGPFIQPDYTPSY